MIRIEFDKVLTEQAIRAIAKGEPIAFGEAKEGWTQSKAIQAAAVFMDVAFHFGADCMQGEQFAQLPQTERQKVMDQFLGDIIAAAVQCLGLTQCIRQKDYDRLFEPKLTLEIESQGKMPLTVKTRGVKGN
jgi:hypothetical protein